MKPTLIKVYGNLMTFAFVIMVWVAGCKETKIDELTRALETSGEAITKLNQEVFELENRPLVSKTLPMWIILEPIQAEAGRRGDNGSAAVINFLQSATVKGDQLRLAKVIATNYTFNDHSKH